MNSLSSPWLAGVVEGFRGRPWNPSQRRRLLRWMTDWGLNSYLYAPLDEFKRRLAWREPYSDTELTELGELIRDCQAHQVAFIFGLSLEEFHPDDPGDLKQLESKLGQARELGCSQFAILFSSGPSPDPAGLGTAHATVANELRMRPGQGGFRWLVRPAWAPGPPADPMATAYLAALAERLEPAIDVLWLGPQDAPPRVDAEAAAAIERLIRRPPVLWDTLFANDYDPGRVHLGPYAGRPPDLRQRLRGIFIQPNCEAELNFVALRTFASYLEAKTAWAPDVAYLAALKDWLSHFRTGTNPVVIEELRLLTDCFFLPHELGERATRLVKDLEALYRMPAGIGGEQERFARTYRDLEQLGRKLERLEDRELYFAAARPLTALRVELRLAHTYLAWLRSKPPLGKAFVSPEHRPPLYRSGIIPALQRLLPMDPEGTFHHRHPLFPIAAPQGSRTEGSQ